MFDSLLYQPRITIIPQKITFSFFVDSFSKKKKNFCVKFHYQRVFPIQIRVCIAYMLQSYNVFLQTEEAFY